ncbi:hypothetical protein [Rhodoferax sp.]|uniref:hypothetical protein n=1 Tax=Rhodoferax sp. TaxID=50421 RepID=UPI0019E7DD2F|nr:hypothetical protein [Rhodoferax sp.]MBE0472663.1 hypothetical protein [Rhodoferax sp.]
MKLIKDCTEVARQAPFDAPGDHVVSAALSLQASRLHQLTVGAHSVLKASAGA